MKVSLQLFCMFWLGLVLLLPQAAMAQGAYTPPTMVTLKMYVLNPDGAILKSDEYPAGRRCDKNDSETLSARGCSAYANGTHPYPFDTITPTVAIDGPAIIDTNNNGDYSDDLVNAYAPSQRYLWDVVAQEYGLHLTFGYNYVQNPGESAVVVQAANPAQTQVSAGKSTSVAVTISGFPNPGSYELQFDMRVGGQPFSTREAGRPWPPYAVVDITVLPCVLDNFVYLPAVSKQQAVGQ